MLDSRHCARKHPHSQHVDHMLIERKLLMHQRLGLSVTNEADVFELAPASLRGLGVSVTAANTVIPLDPGIDTNLVMVPVIKRWARAKDTAKYSVLSRVGPHGQKITRYFGNGEWSEKFFDREDELTSDEDGSPAAKALDPSAVEFSPSVSSSETPPDFVSFNDEEDYPGYKLGCDQEGYKLWVREDIATEPPYHQVDVPKGAKGRHEGESVEDFNKRVFSHGPYLPYKAPETVAADKPDLGVDAAEKPDLVDPKASRWMGLRAALARDAAKTSSSSDEDLSFLTSTPAGMVSKSRKQRVIDTIAENRQKAQEAKEEADKLLEAAGPEIEYAKLAKNQPDNSDAMEVSQADGMDLYTVHGSMRECKFIVLLTFLVFYLTCAGQYVDPTYNCKEVDELPDEQVSILGEMADYNAGYLDLELKADPDVSLASRPVFKKGHPDYSCPLQPNFNVRPSAANISPLQPAGKYFACLKFCLFSMLIFLGIHKGMKALPNKWSHRNQPKYNLGHCVFENPNADLIKLNQMAPSEDQFIVATPFPLIKGVKMSYSEIKDRRQCLQCRNFTRVGALVSNDQIIFVIC